jgi:AbrB family looped-hinge helix DNA binding protein
MELLISKLTTKGQTVIPAAIRAHLEIKAGDMLRYHIKGGRVEIEKLQAATTKEEPTATFTEWGSAEDDIAFGEL